MFAATYGQAIESMAANYAVLTPLLIIYLSQQSNKKWVFAQTMTFYVQT